MIEAHEKILKIEPPYTIDQLKPLVGLRFPIIDERYSWGNLVNDTDELEITSIECKVEIGGMHITGQVMVYSNYIFNGNIRFNAWTSVSGVQKHIQNYLDKQPIGERV